jgi:hypothetical protein
LQLGEKFIELDDWQEERFREVTSHLYHDLEVKEEALKKLGETIQETKQSPSIAIDRGKHGKLTFQYPW